MFDGTDLSVAYGYDASAAARPTYASPTSIASPTLAMPAISSPPPAPSVAQMPPQPSPEVAVAYTSPAESAPAPRSSASKTSQLHADSFWDRLAMKKPEVLKLFALSLVVLMAIAMDRVGTYYLNGYVSRAFLTDTQELLLRISYPVGILLLLWILKAL